MLTGIPDLFFLRVIHTGNSKGSHYLNDLDTNINQKGQHFKIPVYLPYEQTLDLPLLSDIILSYKRGSIRNLINRGDVEAYILYNNEVVDLVSDSYQLGPTENLLLIDSSVGNVDITLPDIDSVGTGNEFVIKKVTDDENTITIQGVGTNTLEGDTQPFEISEPLSSLTIKSSPSGWWVSAQFPSGDIQNGGGGGTGEDGLSAYEIAVEEGFEGTVEEWLESLQGEDGLSLTWRGPWDVSTSYVLNDVVSYQGSSYIAVTNTEGTEPNASLDWDLVAAKGEDGTGTGPGEDKIYPSLAARDSTNNSLVYVGTTEEKGEGEDDEVWQIYRQNVENTNLPREFAEGTTGFIHRWTARESLNYEEI